MQVLIPAGGRGLRLRPLTNEHPKPLLPLGGRPILSRILDALPGTARVAVLVTADLEADFRSWLDSTGDRSRVELYVERPAPGAPAGPVAALVDYVRGMEQPDELLILMGDSLLPFTLEEFMSGASPGIPRLAAYRLPDPRQASRFGVVEIGPDESVVSFQEKPLAPRSPWIYTGCFFVPAPLWPLFCAVDATTLPQMGHLVRQFLELGQRIDVFRVSKPWHDIGTFDSYLEAHRAFMCSQQAERLNSSGNHVEGIVYVHPTAQVTRSSLRNCIVLDGARVADADLSDCVVQAHTRVTERVVRGMLIATEAEHPLGLIAG